MEVNVLRTQCQGVQCTYNESSMGRSMPERARGVNVLGMQGVGYAVIGQCTVQYAMCNGSSMGVRMQWAMGVQWSSIGVQLEFLRPPISDFRPPVSCFRSPVSDKNFSDHSL